MIYVLVFLGMVATDFLWAHYTLALTRHQAFRAGLFAAGLIVLGGFVTVSYVDNHLMLIPAGLGAFVGTFAASKLLKRAA